MKRAVKTLIGFLTINQEEAAGKSEKYDTETLKKAPAAILLTCPQCARMLSADRELLYTVESLGATLKTNEATLDYAVRRLQLPLLCILGHSDCAALEHSEKLSRLTDAEAALYEDIALGLGNAPKKGLKRSLRHIDAQVAAVLERYNDIVKTEKLAVVGLYCDDAGKVLITNYNGLKGKDALAYSLPNVDGSFFLA